MASALANFFKRAGRRIVRAREVNAALRSLRREERARMSIGGNPGPEGLLQGIYTSSVGTPPLMNTRALLEGFDTMPWLRACSEKIGVALGMTDWRLYAVGAPPAPQPMGAGVIEMEPGKDYFIVKAEELAGAVGTWVADEVARRVRKIRGQLEPWAQRDQILQRQLGAARWKNLESLRRRGQLQEIAEHPFYDALETPNPFMGRMGLMKITEVSLDLVGDAFWLKERNGAGTPVGYWPIPAHWVVETPTPYRPFFRVNWRSFVKAIPESEVRWFHEPAPVHPFDRGSGVGWALGDELEIDEYLAKMTKQMFFNDADPKWIFAGGDGTSEQEMRRLERDFVQRNQGFWRKFKPYFLVGGGEDINKRIHEFQRPTMEQLVYPGLRKAQRDVVLQTFGAPPELFGITENSNRATVEAAEYLFARWVLMPRGERLRTILQLELMAEFDDRLVLDFPSPVAEDKEFELNVRKAAPWAWDADEWRHLAGDHPMADGKGKVHLVPLNSYVTTDLGSSEARPAAKPAGPAPPAAAPPSDQARMAELDIVKDSVRAVAAAATRQALAPPPVTISKVELITPAPQIEVHPPEVEVHVASPDVHVAAPEVTVKNDVHVKTPDTMTVKGHLTTAITETPDIDTETQVTERDEKGIKTTVARSRKKKAKE